ncbi:MAG: hypothetical protein KDK25_00785 [Leptospiraceae bacterium]|nr:hypothetical protein [Leptospiraceae bacterium]
MNSNKLSGPDLDERETPGRPAGPNRQGKESDSVILSTIFFLLSGISLLVAAGMSVRLFAFLVALQDFGQSFTYVLETNPGFLLWDFLFIWLGLLGFILFGVLGIVLRNRLLPPP